MSDKKTCGNGLPCVFLNKKLGWVPYDAKNTHTAPYRPKTESWKDPETTLLISIASFRDFLCPKTLYNIFTKAEYPDRITVNLIQQNIHGKDVDCLDVYCDLMKKDYEKKGGDGHEFSCPYEEQILITRINAADARGPQWARAQASKKILERPPEKDEFCMQIDSHMDFVHDFDTKMMDMWAQTDNEYGILSTYVTATENLPLFEGPNARGVNNLHEVPHLCMITLHGQHEMPRNWGTKCARSLPHPKLTNAIWGAGLSFSKCHAERKVPYDPHLPYIFDGEEFSRSVRFFTWGYDIYTPHRVFVVHDYTNSQKDPVHFAWTSNVGRRKSGGEEGEDELHPYAVVENDDALKVVDSTRRIRYLLGRLDDTERADPAAVEAMRRVQRSRYGLGDRRTLEQAAAFTGVDIKNWFVDNGVTNRCGNVDYVPFIESPHGPAYVPRYDLNEDYTDVRDPGSVYSLGVGPEARKPASSSVATLQKLDTDGGFAAPAEVVTSEGLADSLVDFSKDKAFRVANRDSHSLWVHRSLMLAGTFLVCLLIAAIHSLYRRKARSFQSVAHRRINKEV